MSDNFPAFAAAIHHRLTTMSKQELYVVDGLDLFASYLAAFPEGTNPIFRTNTWHDCSCCKQFVRNMGGLVTLDGGKKQSIWACEGLPAPYAEVAHAMDQLVQQLPIKTVFRSKEGGYGAATTHSIGEHGTQTWHHFHGRVAPRHFTQAPAKARGTAEAQAHVLRRGLLELRPEAIDLVLDLIESNGLYRGAEHKRSVQEFQALQRAFASAPQPDLYVWANANSPVARFRNTVIGTLVQDLSEGVSPDRAVRSFEAKVAPLNYKRPTAVITPKMVDAALKQLDDLGLTSALDRCFARLSDISVNDVLWLDNSVQAAMKDSTDLRTKLLGSITPPAPKTDAATPTTMAAFLTDVVPALTTLDLWVSNKKLSNFVSLTAPVHPNAGRLFKWDNNFAWSYDGDGADAIEQKVKAAGGNVNAPLRVSLAWSNYDDLDLHADAPGHGHIFFGNKQNILDVDMNAGRGTTREPVENLSWVTPRNGTYTITVNQYHRRETIDPGFTIQLVCNGVRHEYTYPKVVVGTIQCFQFTYKDGQLLNLKVINPALVGGTQSITKWGLKTEAFAPVELLLTSPNYWHHANGVGNQHWFFMLRNCINPEPVRGIYNEFLRGNLDAHRRVFETIGARTKCPSTPDQLSGLGFSSTRNDEVLVRAGIGNSQRLYNLSF